MFTNTYETTNKIDSHLSFRLMLLEQSSLVDPQSFRYLWKISRIIDLEARWLNSVHCKSNIRWMNVYSGFDGNTYTRIDNKLT